MFQWKKWGMAGVLAMGMPMAVSAADSLEVLRYAISGGSPNFDLRARYETVDQDGLAKNAVASTVRARLGYTTGLWNDFDGMIEFEGITALNNEHYGTTAPKNGYPVIADPEGNELNQAWIRYNGLPKTALMYGRQRLIYDNARFVGNVGWRQNEQTYDGFSLTNTLLPKTTVKYAHLTNVNTIVFTDLKMSSDLLNINFTLSPKFSLVGYAYLLDFASKVQTAPNLDSQTYGLRAAGTIPAGPVKVLYTLEGAQQGEYREAPSIVDADYFLGELGATAYGVTAKYGYEILSGDGKYAFQTRLATLHAFQGWADQFLATPNNGIKDQYFSLGGKVVDVNLLAVYHSYKEYEIGRSYGDELNLQAVKALNPVTSLTAKYAYFDDDKANSAKTADVQKFWLQFEYKF